MIKKIKASASEKFIFIFLIILSVATFSTYFVVKNKLQDYVGWKDPIHYNSVQPYYAYTDEDLSLTEWHNIIVKDKLKEIELC